MHAQFMMQLLRKIVFPFSLIYALVIHIRNFLYDRGFLAAKSYGTPTICVGNLSVGGTGKTPMIELLISHLQHTHKIAVLSRGYRRKTKGFMIVSEESTASEVGDEPLQIYSNFPETTVAVDEDRQRGISILVQTVQPDLILLDDAFQHRKVVSRFSILLTAYDNLYTDDWYLPTGNLRDSKNQAARADLLIVTKCPPDLSETAQARIIEQLKPAGDQKVLFCCFTYEEQLNGPEKGMTLQQLSDKKFTLVTGVANPEPLVAFLNERGLTFEHLLFRDHHYFTDRELDLFNSRRYVLTTEKDYMRSKGRVNKLYYISVRHEFLGNGHEILVNWLAEL
ncbi:MAG TPA: tetraacyldisaccharide 4'-kinase [Eudoraea sp.]|nr:tetraacyldisaccharide 4'-kinase [Eudoraea sp.]